MNSQIELQNLNEVINKHLNSNVDLVNEIAAYIVQNGGKRIRPMLAILIAKSLNMQNMDIIYLLGASVECLHTATLLHDDIVDESQTRRGKATANIVFGNAASVLVGDFLYATSFEMLVEIANLVVMKEISSATSTIAQSEVSQLVEIANFDLTIDKYMQIIAGKTASLFQATTKSAAILANANQDIIDNMQQFGLHLGTAFQLMDDVLDYIGDIEKTGKDIGSDFREQKLTLPLIYALQNATDTDKQTILNAFTKDDCDIQEVVQVLHRTNSINQSLEKIKEFIDKALNNLQALPQNEFSQALIELTLQADKRKA